MGQRAPIFETTYRNYLKEIDLIDLKTAAERIDAKWVKGTVTFPLFGTPYKISKSGITDASGREPSHSVKVVLCKYVLHHHPANHNDDTWVSYKDFRDAAPFADAFHKNTEMALAKDFTGRLNALEDACLVLGGYKSSVNWAYDLQIRFEALPMVPILLLFNDADGEFSANCLLRFERRAEQYLDMECLAILGWLLSDYLKKISESGSPESTLI